MATAAGTGRVVCPKCGANNFDTQAACWQCSASLAGGVSGGGSAFAPARPTPSPGAPAAMPASALGMHQSPVDPSIAIWWAVIFAVLLPSVAIPVGMIFCMLDDRRKMEIGRVMMITGVVALVIHPIVTAMLMQPLIHELQGFVKAWGAANGHGAQPGMNDNVDTSNFPAAFK